MNIRHMSPCSTPYYSTTNRTSNFKHWNLNYFGFLRLIHFGCYLRKGTGFDTPDLYLELPSRGIGLDRIIPILLVYSTLPRISEYDPLSPLVI